MPSQLRSDTARANGAKSHGPKSAATREISSQNSLRHGFTARHLILLECENEDQFKKMEDYFAAMHQPVTLAEQDLVDEMVAARWRLQRIRAIETVILDCEMIRKKPEIEETFVQPDAAVHMAMAFRTLAEDSRCSSLISATNPVSCAFTTAPTALFSNCNGNPPNPSNRSPNPSRPSHLNQAGAHR